MAQSNALFRRFVQQLPSSGTGLLILQQQLRPVFCQYLLHNVPEIGEGGAFDTALLEQRMDASPEGENCLLPSQVPTAAFLT